MPSYYYNLLLLLLLLLACSGCVPERQTAQTASLVIERLREPFLIICCQATMESDLHASRRHVMRCHVLSCCVV